MANNVATIEPRQASVPAAMVARASDLLKPFQACEVVRTCPLPRGFWAEFYDRSPSPQRLVAMFQDAATEILPGKLLEAEPVIRKTIEAVPDRDTITMLLCMAIDSHPPTRPTNVGVFVEMVSEMAIAGGFNHFVVGRACREVLLTAKFQLTPAEILAGCENARRELVSALDDIQARKRIAALATAPARQQSPEERKEKVNVDQEIR